MHDCLFCSVVDKTIKANIVLENDRVLAFHDIHPAAPHHILVVPKRHFSSLNDIDSDNASLMGELLVSVKEVAQLLGVDESGFRVVINTQSGAGQSVFHLHLHLLAGRNFSWPPG